MMPFDEEWWDLALKLCHATEGLHYTQIEKREGTLAWRIACALQKTREDGYSDGHDDGSAPSSKDYGRDT